MKQRMTYVRASTWRYRCVPSIRSPEAVCTEEDRESDPQPIFMVCCTELRHAFMAGLQDSAQGPQL